MRLFTALELPPPVVAALHAWAAAEALGVVEERAYRPHVTAARGRDVQARGLPPRPDLGTFAATAATLLRSHPGSRYEALVSVQLDVAGSRCA